MFSRRNKRAAQQKAATNVSDNASSSSFSAFPTSNTPPLVPLGSLVRDANNNGYGPAGSSNASLPNSSSGPLAADAHNLGYQHPSLLAPPHANSPISFTTSPISPVPPTLPPIPRVSSVRSITDRVTDRDERRSDDNGNLHFRNMSADSWTRTGQLDPSAQGRRDSYRTDFKHSRGQSLGEGEPRKDFHDAWLNPGMGRDFANLDGPAGTDFRPTSSRLNTGNAGSSSSPSVSRPHTAGSSMKSNYQSTSSATSKGTAPDPNLMKSPPIVFMGPAFKEPITSPSKFPSESHRPPPRPPPQPPVHSFSAVPKLGPAPKPPKHKLNLLNPMSLLLRRRSGPGLEHLQDESLISHRTPGTISALPEDYDPRIRGKVVHDFSAPRERRAPSAGNIRIDNGMRQVSGYGPRFSGREDHDTAYSEFRQEREHTPVFKEHFEDIVITKDSEAAIRAEQLANQDFINRNSGPLPPQYAPPPPPKLSPEPPDHDPLQYSQVIPESLERDSPVSPIAALPLSPVVEDPHTPEPKVKRQSAVNRRTTTSTNRGRRRGLSSASRNSRSSIGSDISASGLPAHMLSRSSRFSFQLVGKDSAAQERMLEERHKEREAAKRLANKDKPVEEYISEEEDYDFDDIDGFEEDIPMVGGDEWDYGDSGYGDEMGSSMMPNTSAADLAAMALRGNPVDMNSFGMPAVQNTFNNMPGPAVPSAMHGLGILPGTSEEDMQNDIAQPAQMAPTAETVSGQPITQDDGFINDFDDDGDGFYFDDGLIDEVNFDDTDKFDESVLDDPNHPLYERKRVAPATEDSPPVVEPDQEVTPSNASLVPQNSIHRSAAKGLNWQNYPNPNTSPEQLQSYHDILAAATTKAAQLGRFERKESTDAIHVEDSPQLDGGLRESMSQPSLVPDESRTSKATTISPILGTSQESPQIGTDTKLKDQGKGVVFSLPSDDFEYTNDFQAYNSDFSDYDSNFDDDPFVAAANADALANDFDGEYGTEFGFYAARPEADDSGDEATFSNGGYFGPKDWGEIKRKRSLREPNLTPITERSEYSTRNSFVSLHTSAAAAAQPTSSPGLAQLARMSPGVAGGALWDADMNMDALMKLRRGAWGGSQGSLKSIGGTSIRDAPSSPLASSPIVAMSNETPPRSVPSQISMYTPGELNTTPEVRVSIEEVAAEDGDWEDASEEDGMESDYTDTEDIEDEDGIQESPTVRPSLNVATSKTQQRRISPTRSFSRPFSKPESLPHQPLYPTNSNGDQDSPISPHVDSVLHDSTPPIVSPLSNTPFVFPQTGAAPNNAAQRPPMPTVANSSAPLKHRPAPLSASALLSPLQSSAAAHHQKAASGTFYSPASTPAISAINSPTKSGHSRSGSDTVTYVREPILGAHSGGPIDEHQRAVDSAAAGTTDADGAEDGESEGEFGGKGFRWVVERRRTDEFGVEEVVGRAVVTGGAI
jgi:hypothetical protein